MSRIERATPYTITHPDSSETYRADLVELADGQNVGYRVNTNAAGRTEYVPLTNGVTEELAHPTEDERHDE